MRRPHSPAVDLAFGPYVKYGQIKKDFRNADRPPGNYAPGEIVATGRRGVFNMTDAELRSICTSHVEEFGKQLSKRAVQRMIGRDSHILTDTDIKDAYRDLTIRTHLQRWHTIVSDGLMVAGGAGLSYGLTNPAGNWWVSLAILAFASATAFCGIYLREFARAPS